MDSHPEVTLLTRAPRLVYIRGRAALAAFVAWQRNWRAIGWSFALAAVGTIQVIAVGDVSSPADGWWHGLHGGLVLFVVALAVFVARRDVSALRLPRASA